MIIVPAVFDEGVFKPIDPIDLPHGSKVELIVTRPHDDPVAVLKIRYPQSFGVLAREDGECLMKIIDEQFGRI